MIAEKALLDDDFGVGDFLGCQLTQPFMVTALIQELTVEWTGNRLFALFAAALRADIRP